MITTAVSGSSLQLTLKKGAPGDQVQDLLCVQLASHLEEGALMWMMLIKNLIMMMIRQCHMINLFIIGCNQQRC